MESNYVVYHLHTELSLCDSCTNYKLYVDKAKELGQKAICFTEHGNTDNWIEKKMYCDSNGIKYMHGIEVYLTQDITDYSKFDSIESFNKSRNRDNYHTVLIAKNYEGFKELNSLVSISSRKDHMFYNPRISFDEFKNISSNVIKTSACLASPLNRLRDESLIQYYDYLEVQPHVNSEEQKEYNKWLYQMSIKYNKPLIAATDTHSIDAYKAECRNIIIKDKRPKMAFSDDYEQTFDLTYKSYDEVVDMFKRQGVLDEEVYLQALENTNIMADSVEEFDLDLSFKYPIAYENEEEVLYKRIERMYKEKVENHIISDSEEYKNRLREEIRVFKKIGMIGFMLFMSELVCWCKDEGIPVGFCRGSVGGSVVAYITGIIDVDPVVWNTVFSRFCNEHREEIGD